jgi:hypothetical protein
MPKKPAKRADNRDIVGRIREGLKRVGISPRKASIDAGYGPDLIRDLYDDPSVIPRLDTIESLAPVLRMSPSELAFGTRVRRPRGEQRTLRMIGEVAAGLWLDVDGAEEREYQQYPVPFDPRYPEEAQYGLIVVGTSINRVAQNGDVLQCLDVGISGIAPQEDDVVVVERRRGQAGQKEVTAKRYRPRGNVVELAPDSTDARWTESFIIDPRIPAGDEEIAVIAVVIGVYKPMRRR